ncbi:MAG: hypothetical protein NC393_09320 [Clostridium sp.]|nr:hypothetical protein [Clostridium sp.]MCM1172311.1 hypothetical protein [Clostridium sp.]MCM1208976.1 hypothetical protein [Ruminococcus sp.]
MEKLKKILHKLLFPHKIVTILFVPSATALLVYAFAGKNVLPVIAYLSYFLSAYALTIACCAVIPAAKRKVSEIKQGNQYISRYLGDASLRVKISLYGSLAINAFYAIMQLGLGIYNHSVWFYALSGYYFLLGCMRFFLLRGTKQDKLGENCQRELRHYRFCGIMLLVMNIALSVIVFYIVRQNRGFSYHYIMTIAMAAYTFSTLASAIVNVVRYKKYNSPVMSAAKAINLVAAVVSMLSLETAMITAFGDGDGGSFRRTMTSCTGFVVCAVILYMAVYMIVYATKQLRKL